MPKVTLVAMAVGGIAICAAAPLMAVTAVIGSLAGQSLAVTPAPAGVLPPGAPLAPIPAAMLRLYIGAASTCAGLPWSLLASIGTVESDNGRSDLPGVHSGRNFAGAEGPMQFEPATFARYERPVPPGGADPPTPYDPTDAVFAAARMLCANGAGGAGGAKPAALDSVHLRQAVLDYNHSPAYANRVLDLAHTLAGEAALPASAASASAAVAGERAVAFAVAQIGTPYRWGGETAGVGFDCSGLAQAAWAAAGVKIPRVAQQQFDAGRVVPPAQPLDAGDLVFFAPPGRAVSHVGVYVGTQGGQATMIDAPHSGAPVRVEVFPTAPGAAWGGDVFVGAIDPAR